MTNKCQIYNISINELLSITKFKPLMSVIKSRGFNVFAHIKRSTHGLSKFSLKGKLAVKKSKGRQPKCRLDNVHLWNGFDIY